MSSERLQQRLARELEAARQCSEGLNTKEKLLEAKEKGLEAANAQLASMRSQKENLEVQITQLEAELRTLRLVQTKSKFQLDDSRLAQIKGDLNHIRTQLEIGQEEARMVGEFDGDFKDGVEVKTKSKADLVREAQEFVGGGEVVSAEKKAGDKDE